jgi:ribA/ribD-fused uncharacterized protein
MIAEFQGPYRFLSNFWEIPVAFGGLRFGSSEAAFQAQKTMVVEEHLRFCDMKPGEAKKAGGKKADKPITLRPDWELIKIPVMSEIVHAKFTQNRAIRKQLLETGDKVLIEGNNWHDTFWGVCRGTGTNWLGKILMAERAYWRRLIEVNNGV